MKILTADQIRKADQYTIENEPIESIDLMERASVEFVKIFKRIIQEKRKVNIFCGTGNNGGDGLAVARLLNESGWTVSVYVVGSIERGSEDFKINYKRLSKKPVFIGSETDFPLLSDSEVIVDGLFGSGLSRPIEGLVASLVKHLNSSECTKVSIDIASGLFADRKVEGKAIFRPHHTISFQLPKLAFFQPANHPYVGEWHLADIKLDQSFIDGQPSDFEFSDSSSFQKMIPERHKFSHKGDFGRLLLIAGSKGKIGASVLSAKAALRTGVGLLWVHTPQCGCDIIQSSVPEAMIVEDRGEKTITAITHQENTTFAIGPGIGTDDGTLDAFEELLTKCESPLVVDADAINLLSRKKSLLSLLPSQSILTPHPGEFRRLVGEWKDDFEKLDKLKRLCLSHKLNVVLKGAYSAVCDSNGYVSFNPSGNAGMATAGSGDVLTGIIASLLAQGLKPEESLRLGVYLHGRAGDLMAEDKGEVSLIASDIVDGIHRALTE